MGLGSGITLILYAVLGVFLIIELGLTGYGALAPHPFLARPRHL